MSFWSLILTAMFCVGVSARAAMLSGRVADWKGKAVSEAQVVVARRAVEGGRLSEIEKRVAAGEMRGSDFGFDLPEGVYAVEVSAEGFLPYSNWLVVVEGDVALEIQLASADATEAEISAAEEKRLEAQILSRAENADEVEEAFEADGSVARAAAGLVVPEQVYMSNLNGFTGYMNLDEYIAGVITAEMGDGFPYEALKAQAIAARTYALDRLRSRGYANGGQAYNSTPGTKCRVAAANSSGVALVYQGAYITAFFSARCNGDRTLDSEDGLRNIATCEVGGLVGRAIAYLRSVPCAGHINCSQTAETCCVVKADGRTQYIYGHGVGLCQRGAQDFARYQGFNFSEIVHRFYTGVTSLEGNRLKVGDIVELARDANRYAASPCAGNPLPTIAGIKATVLDGPRTIPCAMIAGQNYLTWWRLGFQNGTRAWMSEDYLKKTPAAQTVPALNLTILRTGTQTAAIGAAGLPNTRVAFEVSSDLATWVAASTNVLNASGTLATNITASAPEGLHYRARLLLPDTAP